MLLVMPIEVIVISRVDDALQLVVSEVAAVRPREASKAELFDLL